MIANVEKVIVGYLKTDNQIEKKCPSFEFEMAIILPNEISGTEVLMWKVVNVFVGSSAFHISKTLQQFSARMVSHLEDLSEILSFRANLSQVLSQTSTSKIPIGRFSLMLILLVYFQLLQTKQISKS